MIHISARKPSLFVREVPYFFKLTGANIMWRRWLLSEWEWSTVDGETLLGENDVHDRNLFPCHYADHKSNLGLGWVCVAWLTLTLELLLQCSCFNIILAIDVNIYRARSVFV
jgi:hypothetical protein